MGKSSKLQKGADWGGGGRMENDDVFFLGKMILGLGINGKNGKRDRDGPNSPRLSISIILVLQISEIFVESLNLL